MASDGGEGPPIPTRPTVIRASREEGPAGQDDVAAVPPRPAPPAPKVKRPPPAVPTQRPQEQPVPVEQTLPPRPQPAVSPIAPSATGSSAKQKSTKRGRPVITVLDAKPMNQVGFRDVSPNPPSRGGNAKPEITVVAARPMSEVGFRSEGSGSIPTPQGSPSPTSKSPDEQLARPGGVPMRHKSRGPAPSRPASVPAKPPPPRVSSVRQQHTSAQGNKLPGGYGDRILVISPEADARPFSEHSDAGRKAPPPRPVSRPQSLQFSGRGSDQDTASESSGYGSQLLTSESHSSLSSVETPSDAPPARKKQLGVQVLPFGPGMMPLRSQLKSSKGNDSQPAIPRPMPSPRSPRKQPVPPFPSAGQENPPIQTPDTEANSSDVSGARVDDDNSAQVVHQAGMMVLPPVPKPREPSPRPQTPRSSTSPPPSIAASTVYADDSPTIEINPWADINQNKMSMAPIANVSTESQEAVLSPDDKSVPMSPSDSSASPPSAKPSVKPKPSPKPKPAVAAKPKPKPMEKPTRPGSIIKVTQDQQEPAPTNQLYPTLPQNVEPMVKSIASPTLQPRIPSPLMPPIQSSEEKQPEDENRPKSPPKKPPARPQSPEKKTVESTGLKTQPPARPLSHGPLSTENQAPEVSSTENKSQVIIETEIEVQSGRQTEPDESKKLDQESGASQVSASKQEDVTSLLPEEIKVQPTLEYDEVEDPENTKSPIVENLSPIVPELSETNLVSSSEKNTESAPKKDTFPKSVARLSQANDSFSDDDEPDAFYTKKNVKKVVDTSLFSLMAAKKDDDSEESQMKRYFSETEIREKESTDPAEAFYRNRPEILSTDPIKPTRLKRPTIIRPKKPAVKPPPKEANVEETIDPVGETPGEKPEAVTTEDVESPIGTESPIVAPPIARRPTIIRAVKQKSQEEPVEVEKVKPVPPPVRPKKVPPPVKPKPKPGRLSQEITAPPQLLSQEMKNPPPQKEAPPQTRPKPATPPPPRPKPLSTKPSPVVEGYQEPSPNVEVSPHSVQPLYPDLRTASPDSARHTSPDSAGHTSQDSAGHTSPDSARHTSPDSARHTSPDSARHTPPNVHPESPRVAPRRPPGGTPSLLSKVQSGLIRTGSTSSVEESENKLNELQVRRESDSSTHSTEKVRHPSAASSAGSEIGDQESSQTKADDQRKSWVPPGAVRVMGAGGLPPPLPRTGPVAVSTPDLRIDPTAENNEEFRASPKRPSQRSYSPPPRPAPERPISKARPKSMSMMALNRPSFEQEGSLFKVHGEVIQEEKVEASSNAPPPKSFPPVKPARPSAPSRKNRSVNVGQTPEEESVADLTPRQPPARPGPPPSPTTKKTPPARAPPPRVPQKERGSPPSLPSRPGPGHPLYHYVVQGPHGIAMFDYTATADDELSFKAGDVIELEEQVSETWLVGRNVDKKGIFPSNFIDIIEPPPVSTSRKRESSLSGPEQPDDVPGTGPRCVGRFDYDSDVAGDLSFVIGDVITLTGRMGDDWLKGKLDEKEGAFPIAFVEIVEDLPAPCDPGPLVLDTAEEIDEKIVTASFDYSGPEGDLTLKKGDKVKVLSRLDNDWLFGEIGGGIVGTFPASFVDRMPQGLPLHSPNPVSKTGSNSAENGLLAEPEQAYCIAEFDYTGEEGDLQFMKGDKILLTGRISDEWLKGVKDDKSGSFPKAFVTIMKDLEEPKSHQGETETNTEQASASPTGKAIALFDFKGESEGDLSLKVGDEVVLLKKDSDEWYTGMVGSEQGMFPVGFIKVLEPLPDTALEPPESFA